MTIARVIAAAVCAAAIAATAVFVARQNKIDELYSENQSLVASLRREQSEKREALSKWDKVEREAEDLRDKANELTLLREQFKTNPPPAAPQASSPGFFADTNRFVFVTYGTPDPMVKAFMKSVMSGRQNPREKGKAIFEKICAACHQPDGMGKENTAPPLVGSDRILASGGQRLARIVLNGLSGPITVGGRQWSLPSGMPPLRENLDHDAVSVVLTYIRSELGTNRAGAINADVVRTARAEVHPGAESEAELLKTPIE